MNVSQAVGSLLYVRVQTAVTKNGINYDPTGDEVAMAFLPADISPTSGDWNAGVWETIGNPPWATYNALCLVGPTGTFVPTQGVYSIWVRVTDDPEVPAEMVGTLTVY